MGLWSAYFFVKLFLHAGGYIDFHVTSNLLFALLTALPHQNRRQWLAKNVIAVPVGIILLYHDSWLPPPDRVFAQAGQLTSFTVPYLLELAQRFVNFKLVAQLVALGVVYALARLKLRLSTFAFIGILAVALQPYTRPLVPTAVASTPTVAVASATPEVDPRNMRGDALDAQLKGFYDAEAQRIVRLPPATAGDVPYDLVIVHVCSLSWDDLEAVQRREDPFFSRFALLLSHFNSAASYSGPAAIRLLRGLCGQPTHKALYERPRSECLVIDGFQNAGFAPSWLMNHDGRFGDFFGAVRNQGGVKTSLADIRTASARLRAFDSSPVYDDYELLSQWWAGRLANPSKRVVLYYNTVTLHDGNRAPDGTPVTFATRLESLFGGLGRFMDDVSKSGRRMIVVFVPEHGAAVLGDRRQIPGLREIPTPAITEVPVGVALLGVDPAPSPAPLRVDTPLSYLGLYEILSRMLTEDPFAARALTGYTQNLPQTESVAENDGTVMMRIRGQDMLRTPDGAWSAWDAGR